jgi:hypothetical protein
MTRIKKILGVFLATLGLLLVGASSAYATTPADPLNGAGDDLVSNLLGNFTTYVIPAIASVILAVYAFRLIVKMGTRFLNRA